MAATGQTWASIEPARPRTLGMPDRAPFERILVSAEARVLPDELVHQLVTDPADPGRMVVPVAGEMVLVVCSGDDLEVTFHGYYRFVPLR